MSVLTDTRNTPEAWSGRASAPSSWEAAGWSEYGQIQRFLAALRHLGLREGDSVLDFGCGTGRFCEFLPIDVLYHGYDWAPGMVERMVHEHPRAVPLEILPDRLFDHVTAIGCFNLADGWSKERTWERLFELWSEHTRRTLVVLLYRGHDSACLRYEPEDAAEFARRLGSSTFAVDATYLPNDLLLELRR
jgi:SAM-dependent methyltransferase